MSLLSAGSISLDIAFNYWLIVSLFILRYLPDEWMSVVSASLKPNSFIQLLVFATTAVAWFSAVAGIPAVADVPALASVLAVAVLYMVSDEAPVADVSSTVLADPFCF
jgi:hypothetical protein